MVIKTIKGTKMLGCENWPRCNYTKRLPEAYNMEAIKAPKLPGFE
jgi:ssDNA-binding Zn-finger/Zn-ribbon topoisomerase 1